MLQKSGRRNPFRTLGIGTRDVVDRAVAIALLAVLAPLLAVLVLAVLVTSGRPVFFIQNRVGRDGVVFRMFKFRTMVNDAVRLGQTMKLTDDPFGIVDNDPRITRVGRLLRRTSLDELPQLINVARGDMRLVGPRPDVPEQAVNYTAADARRLEVKPGITGWAQVNGRDDLPWPERFKLDAWYVDNQSIGLDARIVWMTFAQIGRDEPVMIEDDHNIDRLRAAAGG
ncbi:sugar transferase [Pseudonocardia sp.]|uniref:sugar transferase n=1 Tax=Pseudonocardia sp. TaxID=60912 RepID=UPI003D0F4E67